MTDVVDASRTLHALHQTVGDGNWAGHREVADKTWNTDRCPCVAQLVLGIWVAFFQECARNDRADRSFHLGTLDDALWETQAPDSAVLSAHGDVGNATVELHLRSGMCTRWRRDALREWAGG